MTVLRHAAALVVLVVTGASRLDAQESFALRGIVRDSASGETLPYATLVLAELDRTTQTNADGRFVFARVPAGRYTLRVRMVGYRPRALTVPAAAESPLVVVRLAAVSTQLDQVIVRGAQEEAMHVGSGLGEISIAPAELATLPSIGEVDVFRSLQLLPGVSSAQDGSSGMYVRGGTPDENLVLLDGMTVYHVDHFFGVFSAFNADAIKDVHFYKGAFPAKYGGRTSSVVELTGKTGDERHLRATAGVNLLSARTVLEVPLGRGSWLVSARRAFTDVVESPLYNTLFGFRQRASETTDIGSTGGRVQGVSSDPPFYFYDLNSKLSYRPSESDLVALSVYRGEDRLDQSQTFPAPPDWTGPPPRNVDVTAWGNVGASAHWMRQWRGTLSSDLLVSATRYRSESTRGATGSASVSTDERNEVKDVSVRLDNALPLGRALTLDFGLWSTRNDVGFGQTERERDSLGRSVDRRTTGVQHATYLSAVWRPVERLELTTGMRATRFDVATSTYWEPRASVRWAATPRLSVTGGWGRHVQFVHRVENEDVLRGSRDFWILADSLRPPSAAEHRVVGVTFDGGRHLLAVEAYDKRLSNVTRYTTRVRRPGASTTGPDAFFFLGDGTSRGIELLAQRKFGDLTGWATYTLSATRLRFPDLDEGTPFPASHEQRHQVKLVGSYRHRAWTFSSSWTYGSGRPYTAPIAQYEIRLLDGARLPYIHVSEQNAERLPPYHRLDLAATRRFEWRRARIELGASVFNAYNRRNIWFRRFDLDRTPVTLTDVAMLGFTPSIDLRIGPR